MPRRHGKWNPMAERKGKSSGRKCLLAKVGHCRGRGSVFGSVHKKTWVPGAKIGRKNQGGAEKWPRQPLEGMTGKIRLSYENEGNGVEKNGHKEEKRGYGDLCKPSRLKKKRGGRYLLIEQP